MATKQILHLEKDDDIDVIREKVARAQARQVLLVVPHGSQAFRSLIDFRLLRRQAQQLAREIALVSNHPVTRDLAAQEGVRVYGSIWRANSRGAGRCTAGIALARRRSAKSRCGDGCAAREERAPAVASSWEPFC